MNLHDIPLEILPQKLFWSMQPHENCNINNDVYGHWRCAYNFLDRSDDVIYCECRNGCRDRDETFHWLLYTGSGQWMCNYCISGNCPRR